MSGSLSYSSFAQEKCTVCHILPFQKITTVCIYVILIVLSTFIICVSVLHWIKPTNVVEDTYFDKESFQSSDGFSAQVVSETIAPTCEDEDSYHLSQTEESAEELTSEEEFPSKPMQKVAEEEEEFKTGAHAEEEEQEQDDQESKSTRFSSPEKSHPPDAEEGDDRTLPEPIDLSRYVLKSSLAPFYSVAASRPIARPNQSPSAINVDNSTTSDKSNKSNKLNKAKGSVPIEQRAASIAEFMHNRRHHPLQDMNHVDSSNYANSLLIRKPRDFIDRLC